MLSKHVCSRGLNCPQKPKCVFHPENAKVGSAAQKTDGKCGVTWDVGTHMQVSRARSVGDHLKSYSSERPSKGSYSSEQEDWFFLPTELWRPEFMTRYCQEPSSTGTTLVSRHKQSLSQTRLHEEHIRYNDMCYGSLAGGFFLSFSISLFVFSFFSHY